MSHKLCWSLLTLFACSDNSSSTARDAALSDAELPDATRDGNTAACSEPKATASFDSRGGTLQLCGAQLTVSAGTLAAPTEFTMEVAEAPEPSLPRMLAGPAIRFTPEDVIFLPPVKISLPHGGVQGRVELFAVEDGELFGIEPCTIDETSIQQEVGLLGTFVATVDTYPYSETPSQLGTGTVTTQVGDETIQWTLPETGYAIDQSFDQSQSLQVTLERTVERNFEQMKIVLAADERGATLHFVQWYSASEGLIWQLGTPGNPGTGGVIEVSQIDGQHLQAEVSGSLFAGKETRSFSATLDVTSEYFQYPIELFCGNPKG